MKKLTFLMTLTLMIVMWSCGGNSSEENATNNQGSEEQTTDNNSKQEEDRFILNLKIGDKDFELTNVFVMPEGHKGSDDFKWVVTGENPKFALTFKGEQTDSINDIFCSIEGYEVKDVALKLDNLEKEKMTVNGVPVPGTKLRLKGTVKGKAKAEADSNFADFSGNIDYYH